MEKPIAFDVRKPLPKSPEPLQRVYRVHCTLEREMSIKAFEKHYCLIDNNCSFPWRELFDLGQELIQSDTDSEKWPDGLMSLLDDRSRN
jgi:hypothetical protein